MAQWIPGTDYANYLQQLSFNSDIVSSQGEIARNIAGSVDAAAATIVFGTDRASRQLEDKLAEVIRSVEVGSRLAGDALNRVDQSLERLSTLLGWEATRQAAQLSRLHEDLEELVRLVKTPAQTAAYEQYEIAREAFAGGLYPEALEGLHQAIKGSGGHPGYVLEWRFHYLRGTILLGFAGCDVSLLNAGEAESAFALAARYARASFPREAARAAMLAGQAAFIDGRASDALKRMRDALVLDDTLLEARYQEARVLSTIGPFDDAQTPLRSVIEADSLFLVRLSSDVAFQSHGSAMHKWLEDMRQEKYRAVREVSRVALDEIEPVIPRCQELERLPIVSRWRTFCGPQTFEDTLAVPLLDLLAFEKVEHPVGLNDVRGSYESLLWTVRTSPRVAERVIEEEIMVELEEPYRERRVVRSGWLFPKERVEFVTKTRRVSRPQVVHRAVSEAQLVMRNGLGEEIEVPDVAAELRWIVCLPGQISPHNPISDDLKTVQVDAAYVVADTVITQKLWAAMMGFNPSVITGDEHPVDSVSWYDATVFCNALSRYLGVEEAYVIDDVRGSPAQDVHTARVRWKGIDRPGFRLPTELEWEYAARAGCEDATSGPLDEIAIRGEQTAPVRSKSANAWGLFDALGNVLEWCWDEAIRDCTDINGHTAPRSYRVQRGPGLNFAEHCYRLGQRWFAEPTSRGGSSGRDAHFRDPRPGNRWDVGPGFRIVQTVHWSSSGGPGPPWKIKAV